MRRKLERAPSSRQNVISPKKAAALGMTVFDHIIAGRLPASFVHQDEQCVAFMDIRPIRPGHVLVVPRQSVPTLDELTDAQRAHLFEVAGRVARAQRQALGSRAQHLLVNDGRAASQTVPHVHIHVIPRYLDDSMTTLTRMIWHLTTLRLPCREASRTTSGARSARQPDPRGRRAAPAGDRGNTGNPRPRPIIRPSERSLRPGLARAR